MFIAEFAQNYDLKTAKSFCSKRQLHLAIGADKKFPRFPKHKKFEKANNG